MRARLSGGVVAALLVAMAWVVAPAQVAHAAWSPAVVSLVGVQTGFSAGGSTNSVSAAVPAGAEAGDTMIVSVSTERPLAPTLSGVTGLTTVQSATNGGLSLTVVTAYKELAAADVSATVTASLPAGTVRRMSIVVAVYRNVGSVVTATAGAIAQGMGNTAVSTPSVTPDRNNAVLVGVVNYLPGDDPYTSTFTPGAGWTERADVISTRVGAWNAATWLTERALTGGAGASQSGASGTSTYADGGHFFSSTFALGPITELEYRSTLTLGVDEPTADHTGILPDVPLTEMNPANDRWDITTANTTYENLDVRGRIRVMADNVTLRNVRVRGDSTVPAPNTGLIEVTGANTVIEHVTVRPDVPLTGWNSGVKGSRFTLRFADISGTIDGVNVYRYDGSGALDTETTLEHNYIHDLVWWTATTDGVVNPGDTMSHNDGIQLEGGYGTVIRGNSVHGSYARLTGHWQLDAGAPFTEPYDFVEKGDLGPDLPFHPVPDRGSGNEANGRYNQDSVAAILLSSASNNLRPNHSLTVTDNWLYGGNQTVNGGGNRYTSGLNLGTWHRNRFDRSQGDQGSGGNNTWTLSFGSAWNGHVDAGVGTANQNVYMDNGNAVKVRF